MGELRPSVKQHGESSNSLSRPLIPPPERFTKDYSRVLMSKIAYLDCPTGIAGDMCLGAIVNAGVPLAYLVENLNKLGIGEEFRLRAELVHRNGQQATQLHVDLTPAPHPTSTELPSPELPHAGSTSSSSAHSHAHSHAHSPTHNTHSHPHSHSHAHTHPPIPPSPHLPISPPPHLRHLPEIEHLIQSAHLPARVESWSLAVFRRLAEAEGAVHGIPPAQVHFHEVGATDAIVDIVGTCLGLDWLGIEQIYCSALPTGGGTVWAAHGRLPVPVPAVLKLWELRQVPLYSNGIDHELVTPTGAAIVTTLATQFGPPPAMTLLRIGLGAGSLELATPNILRLWLGDQAQAQGRGAKETEGEGIIADFSHLPTSPPPHLPTSPPPISPLPSTPYPPQTITLLETQIDDLNPQAIGYIFEALLAVGALDVFTQAISMKKSRPGVLLSVVCLPETVADCEAVMFRETTTLGIRRSIQQRQALDRQIQPVQTEFGRVRVKVAWMQGDGDSRAPLNVQPEYEDCATIAREQNLPWREVHRLALQSWYAQQQGIDSIVP
jgi:pyridinium-3,5-bisthiocarboxylic acid mononucleotide nickel chelatase